jgi:hypothetical protein
LKKQKSISNKKSKKDGFFRRLPSFAISDTLDGLFVSSLILGMPKSLKIILTISYDLSSG